jgi:hypothetical protein
LPRSIPIYFFASFSDANSVPWAAEQIKNVSTDIQMDNLAVSGRFIKSLLFAFFLSAVIIFVLQLTNLIDPDHLVGREGVAWLIATIICVAEPLLRHQGVLKGAIESRIGSSPKRARSAV